MKIRLTCMCGKTTGMMILLKMISQTSWGNYMQVVTINIYLGDIGNILDCHSVHIDNLSLLYRKTTWKVCKKLFLQPTKTLFYETAFLRYFAGLTELYGFHTPNPVRRPNRPTGLIHCLVHDLTYNPKMTTTRSWVVIISKYDFET